MYWKRIIKTQKTYSLRRRFYYNLNLSSNDAQNADIQNEKSKRNLLTP